MTFRILIDGLIIRFPDKYCKVFNDLYFLGIIPKKIPRGEYYPAALLAIGLHKKNHGLDQDWIMDLRESASLGNRTALANLIKHFKKHASSRSMAIPCLEYIYERGCVEVAYDLAYYYQKLSTSIFDEYFDGYLNGGTENNELKEIYLKLERKASHLYKIAYENGNTEALYVLIHIDIAWGYFNSSYDKVFIYISRVKSIDVVWLFAQFYLDVASIYYSIDDCLTFYVEVFNLCVNINIKERVDDLLWNIAKICQSKLLYKKCIYYYKKLLIYDVDKTENITSRIVSTYYLLDNYKKAHKYFHQLTDPCYKKKITDMWPDSFEIDNL